MEEKQDEINVKYTKSPDYKIMAATGAFGGPTPQGEILCNFFIEFQEPPEHQVLTIGEGGEVKREMTKVGKAYFTRELQVGVLLRPDLARVIGKWLIESAEKVMVIEPKGQ
ncbi:MAG: hypothetical protein CVU64_02020 [Deltaproteobacteria bacterium HGW-Deltaproteobacteria-21]|nr:MAG: hypothetical protein CVU64_02020 [Deltaproteobacteria bacterium HGW-Deltaproteobacteria-21]